ncbi:MAG: dihydrolipoamide acetyltransferase family protein [Armatimonadota bacterium]|nr:dihydrolipoamide acetyltransferase family protein [Armatimonadota bacterium]MDR7437658.1 dihydrolipoamide acetyltransferase family protein [Armatimonadota bacterium]MDR7471662.1 dihydrolipoamide acetyltransferase family protein [Armatimonadota bacterium]MDR7516851.1 dihydrolipoamide acetyltransferase family protein [Armatimonadota bacterium]MDR7561410.1 dihydrolipoamide acetyltransferase family protein [Armatimonadota bacterium]
MAEVIMPKMGDAMTEGRIVRWKKRPGEPVARGDPLAEIETDKVNVDIEAEEAGVLLQILVEEGQSAPVGAPIAIIGAAGEEIPTAAARPSPPAAAPAPAPAPAAPSPAPPVPAGARAERVKASPLARKLAEEHGIDLTQVRGTGPGGRITREDVEAAIAAAARPAAPAPAADYEVLPLTRIRQTIARRMTESTQQAPHFYITMEVVMDEALRLRQHLNQALGATPPVSVNDLVLKAVALALRAHPALNSALVEGAIRRYRRVNLAVAVALPEGLIAPVVHDCDRLSLTEIAARTTELGERARSGRLRPEDYEGGTFTVSNLGMFGDVDSFAAIINPPHAGILAVGRALPRPVVRDGQIVPATTMKVTLSADHRVTDGAEAARFLAEVKRLLENPLLLVLDRR